MKPTEYLPLKVYYFSCVGENFTYINIGKILYLPLKVNYFSYLHSQSCLSYVTQEVLAQYKFPYEILYAMPHHLGIGIHIF